MGQPQLPTAENFDVLLDESLFQTPRQRFAGLLFHCSVFLFGYCPFPVFGSLFIPLSLYTSSNKMVEERLDYSHIRHFEHGADNRYFQ